MFRVGICHNALSRIYNALTQNHNALPLIYNALREPYNALCPNFDATNEKAAFLIKKWE